MKRAWLLGIAVVGAVGCGSADHAGANSSPGAAPASVLAREEVPSRVDTTVTASRRAVVQSATLTVRVKSLTDGERAVNRLVVESGGFVSASESDDLDQTSPTIRMQLRIPVARFSSLMLEFEGLGERLHKTVKAEDVTGALVDFDARLKNMRAEEESVRDALRRSAPGTYQLEVQHKLSTLRGEIESIEGQRKSLGELAALSSVDLTLMGASQGMAASDKGWMRETWNGSTAVLGQVVQGTGAVAVFLLVMSPVWIPIAGLIVWLARRSRARAMPHNQ